MDNKILNSHPFDIQKIKADSEKDYSDKKTAGWKDIAIGAYKVAEVIGDHFNTDEIAYMVHPRELDDNAPDTCLPIHFLFMKDGAPVFALVVVSSNGFKAPGVVATRTFCGLKGINYQHVYATGTYADWITGMRNGQATPQAIVDKCKGWLVDKVNAGLK